MRGNSTYMESDMVANVSNYSIWEAEARQLP